jgi:hypothetical protein
MRKHGYMHNQMINRVNKPKPTHTFTSRALETISIVKKEKALEDIKKY